VRSPLENGKWHSYDEVSSTQDLAASAVKEGQGGVFFANHQALGRGRFGREWISGSGDSLTFSMAFTAYADHPRAYLVGMSVAAAAAAVIHCELAWPNDLVVEGRKLGGVLTELIPDADGRRIPVVGVGINLNQKDFPAEIAQIATSLTLYNGGAYDPESVGHAIVERLARLPEPNSWSDLAPIWNLFDHTPGKRYRTVDGQEAVGLGIGTDGQLVCSVNGETTTIMAADAVFGA
jgi:BirA family biotin operon repressor/biotin-[acetyl-CoA-carboxylase] ligase